MDRRFFLRNIDSPLRRRSYGSSRPIPYLARFLLAVKVSLGKRGFLNRTGIGTGHPYTSRREHSTEQQRGAELRLLGHKVAQEQLCIKQAMGRMVSDQIKGNSPGCEIRWDGCLKPSRNFELLQSRVTEIFDQQRQHCVQAMGSVVLEWARRRFGGLC